MNLSAHLRARVSALGELSRPLGEARATAFARSLASAVANDVAAGRDPTPTIDGWIRSIATEIAEKAPKSASGARSRAPRSLADVLPEVASS